MTKLVINIIAFLCLVSLAAYGQHPSRHMTLDEAIDAACDSSLTAFRNKNMYLSSYWEFRSYRARRLPALAMELTPAAYRRYMTQRYDWENNIDVFRPQKSYEAYAGLNLSQNFDPLGGKFYIKTSLDYLRNFGETRTTQYSSVPVRIGYSQELVGFNPLKWERRIEPLKFEKAKKELLYNMELLAEQTVSAFFNLALAQTKYELAVKTKANADTLYAVGERRFALASISQADLLTLRLDKINSNNEVENSQIALQKAQQTFNLLIGQDLNANVFVEIPTFLPEIEPDWQIAVSYAKENNPELLAQRQEVLEARRDVSKAKVESVLNASLDVSVGFNQISDDIGRVYKSPMRSDLVSVTLTIPLLDWGMRHGRLNMARNNMSVTQIAAEQQEQAVEEDVLMTIRNFSAQKALIASAQEAVEIARIAFEQTSQRFILGKADINTLTLAQNRQQTANTNYILALQNYWTSYYRLRRLTLFDFELGLPLITLSKKMYGF